METPIELLTNHLKMLRAVSNSRMITNHRRNARKLIPDYENAIKILGDSSVKRDCLIDFIKKIKEEFADTNLDYLDFAADRYLNQLNNEAD